MSKLTCKHHLHGLWKEFCTVKKRHVSQLVESRMRDDILNSIGKRRIPVHVVKQVNKHTTPLVIHKHLANKEYEQAWQLLKNSNTIPKSTANMLLNSLHAQQQNPLTMLQRLEVLLGAVKKSHHFWSISELCMIIKLYGQHYKIARSEALVRNISQYCELKEPTIDIYNALIVNYISKFKYLDGLTQRRYLSKLKTLELEIHKKNIGNHTTSNLLLSIQLNHSILEADKIVNRLKKIDRTGFHLLLNGYLKYHKHVKYREITQSWLNRLMNSGIQPNKKTFILILNGLADQVVHESQVKEYHDMLAVNNSIKDLYRIMREELKFKPDVDTVNTLLKSFIAANDHDQITDLLSNTLDLTSGDGGGGCGNCGCGTQKKKAAKKAVKPDVYTFNMLMQYYLKNNQLEKAFQMYDTMIQLKLEPDTVTYTNFIQYYISHDQVEECLKYVDVMEKKGIAYNNYVYNILLNYSTKYSDKSALIQPYLNKLLSLDHVTLDHVSGNILLTNQHPQDNIDLDFHLFTELLDKYIYSDHHSIGTRTVNTILHSTGKYYKAHQYIDTIEEIVDSLDTTMPDVFTFALKLRNATYLRDMKKAEAILKEMMDHHIKPNLYVFSHLIYGYSSMGNVEKAVDILKHMSSAPYHISPTAINYAPIIKGYAENAEYDKAYEMFKQMLDKEIAVDLVIYTILARVFLQSGNEKRAIDMLEGIEKAGIEADAASLTLLLDAYAQNKDAEQVQRVYHKLKQRDWLDAKAITTLLNAYHRLKNPKAAWQLWNELKESNVKLSSHHTNALLGCLTQEPQVWFPIAKAEFAKVAQPDSYAYDIMIWSAYQLNDYKAVQGFWKQRNTTDSLYIKTYFAAMTAMVQLQQPEAAKQVYQQYLHVTNNNVPNSATVWVDSINALAKNQGFI